MFQVNILCVIGLYRALNGEFGLAQRCLDKATMVFPLDRRIDLWYDYLIAKSIIALEQGDYEQAYTLQQEVLAQSEILGKRLEYLWAKVRIGHLALRMNNVNEARKIFAETAGEFQYIYPLGVVFALEGMAGLFVAIGNPNNAALLIGWADASRKEINDRRPVLEQRDVDQVIAACISRMSEVAFADAYDEGQVMKLDEAVALALNEPSPTVTGHTLPGSD